MENICNFVLVWCWCHGRWWWWWLWFGALLAYWIETGTCIAPFIQSPQRRSAASHIVSNKCVFSNFLKTGKVKVPSLRSIGRVFQATGPATEKPRPPIVTVTLHYIIGISNAIYTLSDQWCINNYMLYEIQPTGPARRLATQQVGYDQKGKSAVQRRKLQQHSQYHFLDGATWV